MNVDPRIEKTTVLKEYFLNAYLIALLKEIGQRAALVAPVEARKEPVLPK